MAKQTVPRRLRWILAASAIGAAIIGLSKIMDSQPNPRSSTSARAISSEGEFSIVPQHPMTFHVLSVAGAPIHAALTGSPATEVSSIEVVWSVDGQEVHRGLELSPDHFRKGQRVEASVRSKAEPATEAAVASCVIANSRPQIRSVNVQREKDSRWLRARVQTSDADGDSLKLEYRWIMGGRTLRGVQGERVSTENLAARREIKVEAIAFDGESQSDPLLSGPVSFENRAPRLAAPSTPRMVRNDEGELFAHLSIRGSDPDGDRVRVEVLEAPAGFRWDAEEKTLIWKIEDGKQQVEITLRAQDEHGASAERSVTVRR